jgi:hypothetical protein
LIWIGDDGLELRRSDVEHVWQASQATDRIVRRRITWEHRDCDPPLLHLVGPLLVIQSMRLGLLADFETIGLSTADLKIGS